MPVVGGKKYPYTAAGKAAAKKAAAAKPKPTPTKKASPTPSPKKTLGPLPKNPTLNDYLKRGLRPPTVGKMPPPDYDVIIPGFNDPATIKKYGKKKK